MKKRVFKICLFAASVVGMSLFKGCASKQAPLPTPSHVDIERFMGRWYVVGYTPIVVDKEARNAIEHYRMDADAKIQTTYQFRDGGFDADLKTYTPVGWVHDEATNAEWRMQFMWPFRSDYIILHVDEGYNETIIAHPGRKYAWIMTRSHEVDAADYERMLKQLASAGYDTSIVKRMPHDWSGEAARLNDLESQRL
ncbi:MAG: lipocalin family protein [Lentimonas sp.]